jgi:2-methylcitrate dehydratase PrpD
MALRPKEHYGRGFHPTATCGTVGAAATAGKLLRLSEGEIVWAMGIAASQAGGLLEFLADGAWTKRLHPGWAAFSGVHAALLAGQGFTGPQTALEGRDGFLRAYSASPEPGRLTDGLGRDFEIVRTAVKPHACCRYSQAPIDAVLGLARDHDLRPQDVERVTIGMLETGIPVICEPAERKYRPQNVVDAQFSLPFGVAVALARRRAGLEEFSAATLRDPTVVELMGRVAYERDRELETNYPREWPAWARVRLKDGRECFAHVRFPKGDPENPLSWDELSEKYRSLAGAVWEAARIARVEERVRRLEAEKSMREFSALL